MLHVVGYFIRIELRLIDAFDWFTMTLYKCACVTARWRKEIVWSQKGRVCPNMPKWVHSSELNDSEAKKNERLYSKC